MVLKIYEMPSPSPMRVVDSEGEKRNATFHHVDGMYSYCTFDDEVLVPGKPRQPFHLHVQEDMVKIDGRWEIVGQRGAAEDDHTSR